MKASFGKTAFCLLAILLVASGAGCSKPEAGKPAPGDPNIDMDGLVDPENQKQLQIPLEQTTDLRAQFKTEFKNAKGFDLRGLYEKWVDRIGANGIIQVVQEVYPTCHDEGHDLGKIIYANTKDIPQALRTCDSACYSGCMHGVFMEAFAPNAEKENPELGAYAGSKHIELEDIVKQAETFCGDNLGYQVGDCIHGIGHAFMFLAEYDMEKGVASCDQFSTPGKRFYCATGAYMEYVIHDPAANERKGGLIGVCPGSPYPAACFRNQFSDQLSEYYQAKGKFADFVRTCLAMDTNDELGCFYGLGISHMGPLMDGQLTLDLLCGGGDEDDQQVCVEGVIERIGKYYPEKTRGFCLQVTGARRETCLATAEKGMYTLDKSFDLYSR